ncbi:hypothetical protein BCR35DRAFT_349873 [Leucosporidium creatinivorum]|uniref:DNA replication regulator Sld3 C-terminal domain-containing protein n=1 Tax=Leucosporidium creatinivorum TaxID=106004 RepID=A0A1Y2G4D4_9BASI|nr:hypothetical protein BCR35DRAFT_349873 [Leucosporidium creatinivorum]
MTSTQTATKARLIYSLPVDCPLPWPARPSYPTSTTIRDLPQAYLDSLFTSNSNQFTLDAFARLLLSVASEQPRDLVSPLLRSLLLPLHDFDRKWRSVVPSAINPIAPEDSAAPSKKEKERLSEKEREVLLQSHAAWKVQAEEKLKADKGKQAEQRAKAEAAKAVAAKEGQGDAPPPKEDATGDVEMAEKDKPAAWTVQEVDVNEWLTERELVETCLQALLLLTLISLPAPLSSPPVKPKKKKDPERHSATLDPELLLDFLTDRLQIWRVMKDVSDMGLAAQPQGTEKVEEQLDEVQAWWKEVVETHYASSTSETLRKHHRTKLFPSATPSDSLSVRLEPAPSPFKDRSLLSLDKSARRKEWKEGQKHITESPTMKRLVGKGGRKSRAASNELEDDVFKVPLPPKRRTTAPSAAASTTETETDSNSTTSDAPPRTRPPRKQERPRPLPRGDSLTGSSKGLFNRREVSLSRRPSGVGLKKKKEEAEKEKRDAAEKAEARKRKRKSVSPKKLSGSSSFASRTLVPDTPAKPSTSSTSQPITRAPSLPSFAALGAAFRPGSSDPFAAPLPFGIPPPPVLPGDRERGREEMDWELERDDEDERFLEGREEDVRRENGVTGTPVTKRTWVVPDT